MAGCASQVAPSTDEILHKTLTEVTSLFLNLLNDDRESKLVHPHMTDYLSRPHFLMSLWMYDNPHIS